MPRATKQDQIAKLEKEIAELRADHFKDQERVELIRERLNKYLHALDSIAAIIRNVQS